MDHLSTELPPLTTTSSTDRLINKFSFNNDNPDHSTRGESLSETAASLTSGAPVVPHNPLPQGGAAGLPPAMPAALPPESPALVEEDFVMPDDGEVSNGSDYSSNSDSDPDIEHEADGEAPELDGDANQPGDIHPDDFAGEHNLAHHLQGVEVDDGAVANLFPVQNNVAPVNNPAANVPVPLNVRAALTAALGVVVGVGIVTTIVLAAAGVFDSDRGERGGHAHASPPRPAAYHAVETDPAAGTASEPLAFAPWPASVSLELFASGTASGSAAVTGNRADPVRAMGDSQAIWTEPGVLAQLRAYQLEDVNPAAPEWTAAFRGLDLIPGAADTVGVAPVMWAG